MPAPSKISAPNPMSHIAASAQPSHPRLDLRMQEALSLFLATANQSEENVCAR